MGDLIIVFLIVNPVVYYVMRCKLWVRIAVAALFWLTLFGYISGIIGYADPHDPMTKAESSTFLWISGFYFIFAWAAVKLANKYEDSYRYRG